ncbi:hypothetical protein GQ54DRAFT_102721 [Martensiomyces pterosporus]|nr:hypothetical protein GQ54DRAFT_102721 [Martensiomyces pterosporus]
MAYAKKNLLCLLGVGIEEICQQLVAQQPPKPLSTMQNPTHEKPNLSVIFGPCFTNSPISSESQLTLGSAFRNSMRIAGFWRPAFLELMLAISRWLLRCSSSPPASVSPAYKEYAE